MFYKERLQGVVVRLRKIILDEIKTIYDEKKIDPFGFARIEIYTRKKVNTYFIKSLVEKYSFEEGFIGITAIAYFNDGEVISLIDPLTVRLNQLTLSEIQSISDKVNELITNKT